jgi:transcriptional regulator with XRE-family HTH domain
MQHEVPEEWVIRRALTLTLQNLRRKAGIAQETLALEAGINRGYLGEMERGHHSPTLLMICRMIPHLHVTFTGFAREFERCLQHVHEKER